MTTFSTEHRADNPAHLKAISDRVPGALEGWKATTGVQANGLPIINLRSPDGVSYHAGQRWGSRNEDRIAVWPADVDYDSLPYAQGATRVSVPEATFAAGRGITGLRQAVNRVVKEWEPIRVEMEATRAQRAEGARITEAAQDRLREAMGPQARATDEGATLYLKGARIEAHAYPDSVRFEWMSLPTEVAHKVIKLIRDECE